MVFKRKRPNEGWFFDLRLLSAEGVEVWKETTEVARKVGAAYYDVRDPARMYGFLDAEIPDVHPWSAEDPYRYTLTVTLRHESSGVVESTALKIGFRRVEIRYHTVPQRSDRPYVRIGLALHLVRLLPYRHHLLRPRV